MKSFFATDAEAKLLTKQDKGIFLRLLKKQPPEEISTGDIATCHCESYQFDDILKDKAYFVKNPVNIWDNKGVICIPLRYPSGVYDVKETWSYIAGINNIRRVFIYKVNCDKKNYKYFEWRSSVAMPTEAVRWHINVETTVKRVQEIDNKDIIQLVYLFENKILSKKDLWNQRGFFADWWNAQHAKPVKYGDEYVCYPYNMSSFRDKYGKCRNLKQTVHDIYYSIAEVSYKWKGKPLIIHANPWVEVISWEIISETPKKHENENIGGKL